MRSERAWYLRLLAVLTVMVLVAAACGDDDDGEGGGSTTTAGEVPEGGTLVIGAEQEPDCADWISICAGSSWGTWMMSVTTMPRTYDIEKVGDTWSYAVSSLLEGEPELQTEPKQVVTYRISEDAVWSDGEPITSSDFRYTWDAIANGTDIYDPTGYREIESVDDSDPKVAVVTFSKPYAGWKQLFGASFGIYPSHLLEGKNHVDEMSNGYSFSGGPWMIDHWTRGVEIELVPNPNWWGEAPKLDSVVFRFITDTSAEFQAFQQGEVSLIYPQPQPDTVEQIEGGVEDANTFFTADTGNLEALWFNVSVFPFDSLAVRQAVSYAIDRNALVERLFGPLGVEEPSNSLLPPILSSLTDVDAFAGYTQDLDKVDELLTGDGWEKGSDGIWAKDGEALAFTAKTTEGNARRALTLEVVQQQLEAAGIRMTITPQSAGDLFGDQLPKGDFQAALYAQVLTSLEPSLCAILCSQNIPSDANAFSGQNWQRVALPDLDPELERVDAELDEAARAEAQQAADAIMAENAIAFPLDPLPNILLWAESVVGPVGDNPILGPFHNAHLWGVQS
jgi:peptide/nickel transport system substrate-binding protein